MANPNSRREFLLASGSTAALGLVSCLTPAAAHPEVKHMKTNPEKVINQRLEDYVHNGIFPIIQAEAVSKHKTPAQMRPIAEHVKKIMQRYGIENLQILQEAGSYPAVYGEIRSSNPDAPTLLIQGHYDGQPSDAKRWTKTKPHQPKIILENGEHRIYGRGTSDDWGQVMTHIAAVDAYQKSGTALPVNIKFLIEGGEEVGSKYMDALVEKYKNLLACDAVMITDSGPGREGHTVITTLARGFAAAYVTLQTGNNNPHSGENIALNAQKKLSRLLSKVEDDSGRIRISGFYDQVRTLSPQERKKLNDMPYDVELFKQTYGLDEIVTEQGYTPQETMWARPSYEVHGFFEGEKSNNIPTRAEAYVTMRLVADQNPEKVFALFRDFLLQKAEELGVRKYLTIQEQGLAFPFSTTTEHPAFKAAEQAMEQAFGASVDYMGIGGTEPIALFHQQILKVPVIFNAYNSPTDHYHGNDESFSIERSFVPGIKANVLFYENMKEVR